MPSCCDGITPRYSVRRLVQGDWLRPQTALHYLPQFEQIADQAVDKLVEAAERAGAATVNTVCQEFALDCVGVFALGTRLGTLQGRGDGRRIIQLHVRIALHCCVVTGARQEEFLPLLQLLTVVPTWLAPRLPQYRTLIKLMEENFDLCRAHVQQAVRAQMIRFLISICLCCQVSRGAEGTLLGRLADRCGPDSPVLVTMGVDAIGAYL